MNLVLHVGYLVNRDFSKILQRTLRQRDNRCRNATKRRLKIATSTCATETALSCRTVATPLSLHRTAINRTAGFRFLWVEFRTVDHLLCCCMAGVYHCVWFSRLSFQIVNSLTNASRRHCGIFETGAGC